MSEEKGKYSSAIPTTLKIRGVSDLKAIKKKYTFYLNLVRILNYFIQFLFNSCRKKKKHKSKTQELSVKESKSLDDKQLDYIEERFILDNLGDNRTAAEKKYEEIRQQRVISFLF
jgi:hypothetical protein